MPKKGRIKKYFGTDRSVCYEGLSFELCSKLPEGFFNQATHVVCRDNEGHDMHMLHAEMLFMWPLTRPLWFFCPTAEEFMARMPAAVLEAPAGKCRKYTADWIWGRTYYNEVCWATGKTPVEALCKCFLKAYKEIKKKEQE